MENVKSANRRSVAKRNDPAKNVDKYITAVLEPARRRSCGFRVIWFLLFV